MERRTFLSSTVIAGVTINPSDVLAHPEINLADKSLLKPFYLPPAIALTPGPGGLNIRTLVKSTQTNNQISSIEGAIAAKTMGPSPHVHQELDEMMFVQEGTVHVLVGSEVYEVKAGGILFRPHGIVHTFWNASNQPARFIDMFFGQDFENYLEELFFKIMPNAMQKGLAPNSKEVLAQLEDLDTRYGIIEFHEQRQAIVEKYGLKG